MILNFETISYKLCFAELRIIYQSTIDLTYYIFITNNYIFYFF